MKRVMVGAVLALGTGCFNFESAYQSYCDGGRCVGTTGGGSNTGGGSTATGGGNATGGGSSTGGGAATGGGSAGGGAATGGGSAGGGAGRDAGCLGYGATCTAEGDCCATSDAGLPMACSRNNYCQDVAPDCRNEAFTCSRPEQCCSHTCTNGKCAACGSAGDSCTSAATCCAGSACVAGKCSDSLGAANGERCQGSDICQSEWCDARDAGSNDGVCTDPGTACTPAGVAATTLACCPGLTQGATCCMPDLTWCYHGSECCSGECWNGRCGPQPGTHGRCDNSANCTGRINLCDPVNSICTNRWCLPAGLNAFSGCCRWASDSSPCVFADGGVCLLPGIQTSNAASCCSGRLYTPTTGPTECDAVQLF
jgi:hypothetical protein